MSAFSAGMKSIAALLTASARITKTSHDVITTPRHAWLTFACCLLMVLSTFASALPSCCLDRAILTTCMSL